MEGQLKFYLGITGALQYDEGEDLVLVINGGSKDKCFFFSWDPESSAVYDEQDGTEYTVSEASAKAPDYLVYTPWEPGIKAESCIFLGITIRQENFIDGSHEILEWYLHLAPQIDYSSIFPQLDLWDEPLAGQNFQSYRFKEMPYNLRFTIIEFVMESRRSARITNKKLYDLVELAQIQTDNYYLMLTKDNTFENPIPRALRMFGCKIWYNHNEGNWIIYGKFGNKPIVEIARHTENPFNAKGEYGFRMGRTDIRKMGGDYA